MNYDGPMGIFEDMEDDDFGGMGSFIAEHNSKPVTVIQIESMDSKLLTGLIRFLTNYDPGDDACKTLITIKENKEFLGDGTY